MSDQKELRTGISEEKKREESKPESYKDLLVWQKGIRLVKEIYQITGNFPDSEKYGLVAQMRRAAVSVPSNIAEGQARHTTGEFVQFVSHAEGSVAELETQIIISLELGYCHEANARGSLATVRELRKMLNALRRKLVTHHSSLATG